MLVLSLIVEYVRVSWCVVTMKFGETCCLCQLLGDYLFELKQWGRRFL
jgi:hypothetical protein